MMTPGRKLAARQLQVLPCTRDEANAFIKRFHRHNGPVVGHRFALAAFEAGEMVGVVVVGRTTARALHDRTTAEVVRLCTSPVAPKGTDSKLHQHARRAWQAQGGVKLYTYTLQAEGRESLSGAGWVEDERLRARSSAGWQSRQGRQTQAVVAEPKIRWIAPTAREEPYHAR